MPRAKPCRSRRGAEQHDDERGPAGQPGAAQHGARRRVPVAARRQQQRRAGEPDHDARADPVDRQVGGGEQHRRGHGDHRPDPRRGRGDDPGAARRDVGDRGRRHHRPAASSVRSVARRPGRHRQPLEVDEELVGHVDGDRRDEPRGQRGQRAAAGSTRPAGRRPAAPRHRSRGTAPHPRTIQTRSASSPWTSSARATPAATAATSAVTPTTVGSRSGSGAQTTANAAAAAKAGAATMRCALSRPIGSTPRKAEKPSRRDGQPALVAVQPAGPRPEPPGQRGDRRRRPRTT